MKVVHAIAGLWEGTGGPATSVPSLCSALARAGVEVVLVTGRGRLAPAVVDLGEVADVRTARLGPYCLGNAGPWFGRELRRVVGGADVVHGHGLWLQPNWVTASTARRARKPLVVSPRGMLAPRALERKAVLKRVLWMVRDRFDLGNAQALHVTSEMEADAVAAMGLQTPIAVIPNGVDVEGEFSEARIEEARSTCRGSTCRSIVVLSRLHPHKGIAELLRAWRRLSPPPGTAELLLAGWGKEKTLREILQNEGLEGNRTVRFVGAVAGRRKLELLAQAWVLVLPSKSENYGLAVAEALACRTPVVTTTGTPWRALVEEGSGWRVRPTAADLAVALSEAIAVGVAERNAMGERGRRLIEREHSSVAAAARMRGVYAWLAKGAEAPDCLRTQRSGRSICHGEDGRAGAGPEVSERPPFSGKSSE